MIRLQVMLHLPRVSSRSRKLSVWSGVDWSVSLCDGDRDASCGGLTRQKGGHQDSHDEGTHMTKWDGEQEDRVRFSCPFLIYDLAIFLVMYSQDP
jgi:hypothetical protein